MKKILLLSALSLIIISACKKKENNPSIIVTASFPKITLTTKYFSVPVGALRPVVQATAYDSFYKESVKVVTIDSNINTFVPGLYRGLLTAQNQYGYISYASYYVAVTNVPSSLDLSGRWYQNITSVDSSTLITRLANGLYVMDNVNGVNVVSDAPDVASALFAVTSNTTIVFSDGTPGTLGLLPIAGDTTITYDAPLGYSVTFSK